MKRITLILLVLLSYDGWAMTPSQNKKVIISSQDSLVVCTKFMIFETAWFLANHIINQIEQLKKTNPTISYSDTRTSLPSTRAFAAQGLALMCKSQVPTALITPWGLWRFIDDLELDRESEQKIGISLHELINISPVVSYQDAFALVQFKQSSLPVFKLQKSTPLNNDYRLRLLEWSYFQALKNKRSIKKLLCKTAQARL